MSKPFSTGHSTSRRGTSPASRYENSPVLTPAEQLHAWATLVAGGEAAIPTSLEPAELSIVLAEVARLRRERLVRFLARSIAQDIHGDRGL
jgi:hypothetical protein